MKRTLIQAMLALISTVAVAVSIPVSAIQVGYRIASKKYDLWYYFHQIALSNDNTLGTIFYGSKHSISAITGAKSIRGSKYHRFQEGVIDFLFYPGHCMVSAKKEKMI